MRLKKIGKSYEVVVTSTRFLIHVTWHIVSFYHVAAPSLVTDKQQDTWQLLKIKQKNSFIKLIFFCSNFPYLCFAQNQFSFISCNHFVTRVISFLTKHQMSSAFIEISARPSGKYGVAWKMFLLYLSLKMSSADWLILQGMWWYYTDNWRHLARSGSVAENVGLT